MYGVVIGDIAGSRNESPGWNLKSKDFEIFDSHCRFTDDTVMSLAVSKALLTCVDNLQDLDVYTLIYMREFAKRYPNCGYEHNFKEWLRAEIPEPYGSFDNGAAMRISACGYAGNSIEEVKNLSKTVTVLSHNHPEAIKGAEAVAVSIYLARNGTSKKEIRAYIDQNYYPMNFTLDEIRPIYQFNSSCQGSVPQALMAFFESLDFEDAIRNAVSIGGDSDTIAAIAGSVAEACYGIPERMRKQTDIYLDDCLLDALHQFEQRYPSKVLKQGQGEI